MGGNYLSVPKLQRYSRWSLVLDTLFHPTLYWTYDYLSILELDSICVSKRGWQGLMKKTMGVMGNYIAQIYQKTNNIIQQIWVLKKGVSQIQALYIVGFEISVVWQMWLALCYKMKTYMVRKGSFHTHDDVIKWKHIPRYWPFVRGIHQSPVNSPHKDQWRGALMFSLICNRINGWVNNREAGDLRRHRAHYDAL